MPLLLAKHKNGKSVIAKAKDLRNSASPIERKLWDLLKLNGKTNGLLFRRQHPVDPYIVDFICLKARLIIEIDGPSHDTTQKNDLVREEILKKQGFSILRFSNQQVIENTEGVVQTILCKTKSLLT